MLEGRPLKGYDLERLKEFLKSMDLDYDTGIEYSICLEDEDYRIIPAGSVEENVLKCIAISPMDCHAACRDTFDASNLPKKVKERTS